jgi:hypothetical protein
MHKKIVDTLEKAADVKKIVKLYLSCHEFIFTRSPHSGERGNAIVMYGCVYVCHEVSQTRCGRTLRHTALVFGSFERSIPLVSGGIKSVGVSRDLDQFI